MKSALFLAPALLLLGACAPKAILVEEADQPSAPAVAEKQEESTPPADELPNFRPNDGLLDPSGLTAMPTERDMKPTVGPVENGSSTVIANPPDKAKPTSE